MNSVSLNIDVSVQSPVKSCNHEFHQRAQCSSMKAQNVLVLWISSKYDMHVSMRRSVSKINKKFDLKFVILITYESVFGNVECFSLETED